MLVDLVHVVIQDGGSIPPISAIDDFLDVKLCNMLIPREYFGVPNPVSMSYSK